MGLSTVSPGKKIKMGKPGTLAQGLDDMQMTLYSTYTY